MDGRFTGAVEDAQPAADLLEAHSLLVASLLDDSEPIDSTNGLLIAGIGILTGKPDLASRGYALLADEFMKLEEFENARTFGEKAAFAGNSSILTELNELEERKATEQAEREAEETAAAQAAAAPETNIHPVATPGKRQTLMRLGRRASHKFWLACARDSTPPNLAMPSHTRPSSSLSTMRS